MVQMDIYWKNVTIVKMAKLLNIKVAKMLLRANIYKRYVDFLKIVFWVWLQSLIYFLDIIKYVNGLNTPWNFKGKRIKNTNIFILLFWCSFVHFIFRYKFNFSNILIYALVLGNWFCLIIMLITSVWFEYVVMLEFSF